jgi:hypothetical protein
VSNSGGAGDNGGLFGEKGTVTGKKCPEGLYGTFCEVSPFFFPLHPMMICKILQDLSRFTKSFYGGKLQFIDFFKW